MKTIIGKRDATDPSIEYCLMTPIDFSKPMKKVEVYTDTMYNGNKLVLYGQLLKLNQMTRITGYNSFEIIGVLPDNYVIKSLKIDKHVVVELFEKFDNHLLIDKYDRTSYNLQLYKNDVPQLSYNFKYKTFRHKYIKITYRYALGLNNLYNIFPSNLLTSWNYNSKTNEEKTETKRTDEIPFEYSADDVKTARILFRIITVLK